MDPSREREREREGQRASEIKKVAVMMQEGEVSTWELAKVSFFSTFQVWRKVAFWRAGSKWSFGWVSHILVKPFHSRTRDQDLRLRPQQSWPLLLIGGAMTGTSAMEVCFRAEAHSL